MPNHRRWKTPSLGLVNMLICIAFLSHSDHGPENFMPLNYCLQGMLQGLPVQLAVELNTAGI